MVADYSIKPLYFERRCRRHRERAARSPCRIGKGHRARADVALHSLQITRQLSSQHKMDRHECSPPGIVITPRRSPFLNEQTRRAIDKKCPVLQLNLHVPSQIVKHSMYMAVMGMHRRRVGCAAASALHASRQIDCEICRWPNQQTKSVEWMKSHRSDIQCIQRTGTTRLT
jgi:hypothetical protein